MEEVGRAKGISSTVPSLQYSMSFCKIQKTFAQGAVTALVSCENYS